MGEAEVHALFGRPMPVFADVSRWRKFGLSGSDASRWLNDIVTNRVDDLRPYKTRRTLLLDRTGHVRADFHVFAMPDDSFVIVQDAVQPRPAGELMIPYVLSADVTITDQTAELGLLCHPHSGRVMTIEGWSPGVLGSGFDQIVPAAGIDERRTSLGNFLEASEQDLEVWRIQRGTPRFGVDFDEGWLPSEADLDDLIDTTKGCFLGQESVARVRNLGHPPRLVLAFHGAGEVLPMALVLADGEEVGRITSVAPLGGGEGTACIGWVRWEAREASLTTDRGVPLRARSDHAA
ncbi:MAG: YgfZ/GcvT domain-containing protein [Actinomycetota bacterium]